jgi:hypothetical protein
MKKTLVIFTGVLSHPYTVVIGLTALSLMLETAAGVLVVLHG